MNESIVNIRRFTPDDRALYMELAEGFYKSPAVVHTIPSKYIQRTFDEMMRSDVYVDGFLFETDDRKPMGYALIAKTFSQEPGGLSIWVEELCVLPAYQGQGVGTKALRWLEGYYPACMRIRLEVEPENIRAIELYKRLGYGELAYYQMVKDKEDA